MMLNLSYDANGNPLVINKSQVEAQKRRTNKKGYITQIDFDATMLNNLIIKHYGKFNKEGELEGIYDPYSGELITDASLIELEHIIAVNHHGGTTIFNSIHAKNSINASKNGTALEEWWLNQDFYKDEYVERLLDYIFDGYSLFLNVSFDEKKQKVEEITVYGESSKLSKEKTIKKNVCDIDIDTKQKDLQLARNEDKMIGYTTFIKRLIGLIKEDKREKYIIKYNLLISHENFKKLEIYEYLENILINIIKEYNIKISGLDDRHELTIIKNINITNILNKLDKRQIYDWNKILKNRFNNIEILLKKTNCSMSTIIENIDKKKVLQFLLKDEIDENEFYTILKTLPLSTHDAMINIIKYVEESATNSLPLQHDKNDEDKKLGIKVKSIKNIRNNKTFNTKISKSDLVRLGTSEYEVLQNLYKEIMEKYEENYQKKGRSIRDYEEAMQEVKRIGQPLIIYYERIKDDEDITKIIEYVEESATNSLPSTHDKNDEDKKLGTKVQSIKSIQKKYETFHTKISKSDLVRLGTSEYEVLQNLYKEIMEKYEENYQEKGKSIRDYEEAMQEVKRKGQPLIIYYEKIKDDEDITKIIEYVEESATNSLPTKYDKNDEDKKLGRKVKSIKSIQKKYETFYTKISKSDLVRLGTSEYEVLQNLYKEIMEKYEENYQKKGRYIGDYEEAIQEVKRKGQPLIIYYEKIKDDEDITKIIEYVKKSVTNSLPTKYDKNDEDKILGRKVQSIKKIQKKYETFDTKISKSDLVRLGTSEYEVLQNLYKEIMEKYEENYQEKGKSIRDYEEAMQEVKRKGQPLIIYYEKIKDDEDITKIIEYVKKSVTNSLPTKYDKNDEDKILGIKVQSIKKIQKKYETFATKISKSDLVRLGTSEYEELQNLYKKIMEKYKEFYQEKGKSIRDYEEAIQEVKRIGQPPIKYKKLKKKEAIKEKKIVQETHDIVIDDDLLEHNEENEGRLR